MLVVSSENSRCDLIFLISRNWCRDLTLSAFTTFLCGDLDSMSRPHFCCRLLFFLVTAPLFMLQRHSVIFSLQAGCDSTLLVCLFSCLDVVIWSQQSSFFNQCNSCRDLTVIPFAEIYVATSIPCRNIISVSSYIDLCYEHAFLTL